MDTTEILEDLRRKRDQLAEAIIAFERLAAGSGPRRGRPPKWLATAKTDPKPTPPARKKTAAKKKSPGRS